MFLMRTIGTLFAILLMSPCASAQDPRPTKEWPTATPKEVGLDPAALARFDADIEKRSYTYVDSVMIIRHGKLVFDRTYQRNYEDIYGDRAKKRDALNSQELTGPYNYYATWWHPRYRRGDLHTLQSITKTIVSTLLGIAIMRGDFPDDLDTPVMKYFDEKKVANVDARKRAITIRHLLTMTSGVQWHWTSKPIAQAAEDTDVLFESSADWLKFAIDRPMADVPGQKFNYASGNAQILAHIFNNVTGKDIEEYAAQHLFAPLGIRDYYWKRTPTGIVDASGGLYLRPHDLAKIGYLYLHNGAWDGKQVVKADWVKASVTGHVDTPEWFKGSQWGYLWGVLPYGNKGQHTSFGATGFGGQGLIVLPDHDAVIVYTGWSIIDGQNALSPPTAIAQFQKAMVD